LDETEVVLFTRADQQFHFVRGVTVVFDTARRLAHPSELQIALPEMSVGSVFYHFIDARRRDPLSMDDFRAWLTGLGPEYEAVCDDLAEVDPYFESLYVLRDRLAAVFAHHFGDVSHEMNDDYESSAETEAETGEQAENDTSKAGEETIPVERVLCS